MVTLRILNVSFHWIGLSRNEQKKPKEYVFFLKTGKHLVCKEQKTFQAILSNFKGFYKKTSILNLEF